MPRHPRIFEQGSSVHVMQRGGNRRPTFEAESDYRFFLKTLHRKSEDAQVGVHAFVLMPNHFHLLVTPEHEGSLSMMMHTLSGEYARHFNWRHNRSGPLWGNRYKALQVPDDQYWFTCLHYIEQNPVRAGLVARPSDYLWSTCRARIHGPWPNWLASNHRYLALADTEAGRQLAYRDLAHASCDLSLY